MKTKNIALLTSLIGLTALSASAQITDTSSFGTLPGATFAGTGIPNTAVEMTTISGLPNSDVITLGLTATSYTTATTPVVNVDSAGTFSAATGIVMTTARPGHPSTPRATWNFDFSIGLNNNDFSDYTYKLVYGDASHSTTIDPTTFFTDNAAVATTGAQNSENLIFSTLGTPIGFNPNANDTYTFTLEAFSGLTQVGSDEITVNVSSVPDVTSTLSLLGIGLGALAGLRRRLNRA